jgi:hypothetical protein
MLAPKPRKRKPAKKREPSFDLSVKPPETVNRPSV